MSADEAIHAGSNPANSTEAPPDEEPCPTAYGYFRASSPMEGDLTIKALMESVQRYCALEKLDLKGFYADEAEFSGVRLWSRPRGGLLHRRLERGDHVVFPIFKLGFRNAADMCTVFDSWTYRGVIVHICDLNFDSALPPWPTLSKMFTDLFRSERKRKSERRALVVNALRRQEKRFTRRAPFGYRWEPDPKGAKNKRGNPAMVMVADEAQQRQLRQIAKMHEKGMHYCEIWYWFYTNNIKRASDGKDWDLSSIWHVIHRLRLEKWKREGR